MIAEDPDGRKRLSSEMLISMSDAGLDYLEESISKENIRIKDQLGRSKVEELDSPDWLRRAKSAKRFRGRELQLIARERGRRRKVKSELSNQSWERQFVEIAKETLSSVDFQRIVDTIRVVE